jgi:Carboxypeptidase regulatory-like domain
LSTGPNQTKTVAWPALLLACMLALVLPAVASAAAPGAIEGTVTAEGGGALAEVEVCAEEIGEEEFGCTETDATGEYDLTGLAAGEYKVIFLPYESNYVRQFYDDEQTWNTATPVAVAGGATTHGIDAVLEKGAKISGVVTAAATGQPVAGVEVCAFSTTETGGCAKTNAAGSYTIIGLPGGQFEVEFFPEGTGQGLLSQSYSLGLVTVPAHGEVKGVNQALQPGGQITGTVRLAATGAPLAGVRVCLTEAEFLESLGCLTTPASGAYRFFGIWNGDFKIVFSAEANEFPDSGAIKDAYPTQWWKGATSFTTATPIAITPPATVSGIDAALGPPPAVITPPSTPAKTPAEVPVKKKALKCKHGLVKRKVRGKARCVKLHKLTHHRRHKKSV